MKVQLPSNGVVGFKSLDIDVPRFSNLRAISYEELTEEEVRTALIKEVAKDKDKVDEITIYDRDYIFKIIVSALHMNKIQMRCTCPFCGKVREVDYVITEYQGAELPVDSSLCIKKKVAGEEYSYIIPQVKHEYGIIEYAKTKDDYRKAYEEALISVILGQEPTDSSVEWVSSKPLSVYYSAMLFNQVIFHGLLNFFPMSCDKCQGGYLSIIPFNKGALIFDTNGIMTRYQEVSKVVDFKSFLDLTLPEFELLRNSVE